MKSIINSKTFWFQILTIVIAIAAKFGYAPGVEESGDLLVVVTALINVALRMVTKSPVSLTGGNVSL